MRKLNTFVLALAVATTFAVGAYAEGKKAKHPGLWIKYETAPLDSKCFVAIENPAATFCPYDTDTLRVATTIGIKDLPPITSRIYLPPTGAGIKLSQNR